VSVWVCRTHGDAIAHRGKREKKVGRGAHPKKKNRGLLCSGFQRGGGKCRTCQGTDGTKGNGQRGVTYAFVLGGGTGKKQWSRDKKD